MQTIFYLVSFKNVQKVKLEMRILQIYFHYYENVQNNCYDLVIAIHRLNLTQNKMKP